MTRASRDRAIPEGSLVSTVRPVPGPSKGSWKSHRPGKGLLVTGTVLATCWVSSILAQEPAPSSEVVIPPGQEDLLWRMLDPPGLPCPLAQVQIERDRIRGSYRCPEGPVEVLLRPRTTSGEIILRIEGPPEFRRILEPSVVRTQGQVRFERPVPRASEPPAPPRSDAPPPEYDAEEQARYDRAEALVKDGRCPEALRILEEMARREPQSQTLGLMVVCLAADAQDPHRVREEVLGAEAHPDDPLRAFRAGVISHYAGHRLATTREGKAAFYRDAIRFLDRTLPAYDRVTRVHLYRAVSHYRLGHQAQAEADIEKAIALAERTGDADAWYCRAEIRHRKDLDGALRDIATYFEIMERNIAEGAIHSPAKQRRVRAMQGRLERARAGIEPLRPEEDLFDPLPNPWVVWIGRYVRVLVPGGIGVLAVAVGLLLARTVRRRSRSRRLAV